MSAADVAVGMMDGAYFTSRNELLTFFNTLLNLNLTKIEQTASGAVACQLTEYLFPGSIPMSKVDWSAKSSHEYVANYKLLQKAFTKNKVQRYVDVDKLIRGKYQDNLEFCQWLKAFWDMQNGGGSREDYDPVAVRAKGKGGKMVATNKGGSGGGASSRARAPPVRSSSSVSSSSGRSGSNNAQVVGKARIGSSASSSSSTTSSSARPAPSSATATTSRSPRRVAPSTVRSAVPRSVVPTQKENNGTTNLPPTAASRKPTSASTSSSSSSASAAEIKKYQEEITTLKSQQNNLQTKYSELQVLSSELEMNIVAVESERDFYFEKLRGIEVMLQVYKEKEESGELGGDGGSSREMKMVIDKIFKVMYAAMEDNVVVDDEGNLIGDVALDDSSVLRSNASLESFRPQAQDEIVDDEGGDELLTSGIVDPVALNVVEAPIVVDHQLSDDDDDDELLTSGIVSPVNEMLLTSGANDVAVENVVASANQQVPPPESDDDDDDELLTSGIVSPVNDVLLTFDVNDVAVIASANQQVPPPESDDEDDDELLTSGIDSGDEAADDEAATNRSAENARIISQLVGDNDDDISDEDLLEDEASQDEY